MHISQAHRLHHAATKSRPWMVVTSTVSVLPNSSVRSFSASPSWPRFSAAQTTAAGLKPNSPRVCLSILYNGQLSNAYATDHCRGFHATASSMSKRNPYDVIGVSKTASANEIKKLTISWRKNITPTQIRIVLQRKSLLKFNMLMRY
ncbi:hypothetical protein BASA61_010275 [Batrachochytrium salamandrivorans]|nr:hypothetical protein BASA61_010275 [Batrachochytrium salamandrivorans]